MATKAKGAQSLAPYQIGTGVVSGKERLILHFEETFLDLVSLLNSARLRKALSLENLEAPASLMQVMDRWTFWSEELPRILEYALALSAENGLPGKLEGPAVRWLPPLVYPRKLICVGTNYEDHIAEMGVKTLPRYPYSFLKPATTTLMGSGETVNLPESAEMVDWEAELAVVVGKKVRNVRGEEAMAAVAGYSGLNDLSARDWIEDSPPVGVDWIMQKAFDGFTPMGTFVTPAKFVPDPQDLPITLRVNGEIKQESSTARMIFSVQEIVEHLSAIMTLEPGDVIATGTPAGVGYAKKPQEFLKPGDNMRVEIEGLGFLETPVK